MLDRQLRRWFPAVVVAAIALAAFFQASGIGALVGAVVPAEPPPPAPAAVAATAPRATRDGRRILERNPFDSATGSLVDDEPDELQELPAVPPRAMTDPLADPTCSFGRVVLITASDDPAWSFAAIEVEGGASQLRRVGDEVEQHRVQFISYERVWFDANGARCQMRLGDRSASSAKRRGTGAGREARGSSAEKGSGKLTDEIAAKIERIGEHELRVERSAVEDVVQRYAELKRFFRIEPIKDGDEVTGIGLRARKGGGGLLEAMGLQDGDQLRSINGIDLTDPQRALEAYGKLRAAGKLSLEVLRNGQPITIEIHLK